MMTRKGRPTVKLKEDQDLTWKSGAVAGTGLDDYRLDVMKLE
jgi:hypothetical protein